MAKIEDVKFPRRCDSDNTAIAHLGAFPYFCPQIMKENSHITVIQYGLIPAFARKISFILVVAIMGLGFFPTFSFAAKKLNERKKPRSYHKTKKANDVPIVSLPVLDTTCIDTIGNHQRTITEEINRWSNVRYKYGGMSPKGIDCSGFTYKVFQKALNLTLPRTSREQSLVGDEITKDELAFGDLLFFYSKSKRSKRINHVGIYVGDGNFVHSRIRRGVGMDSLEKSYYAKHFAVAKRIIPLAAMAAENEE
jgi:probable lipoprotein NlpC